MRLRRLAILGTTFWLTATTVLAQGGITVQVGDIRAPHGQDVEIPIEIKGAQGVGAMHIEMAYDPAVLSPLRDVQIGDVASGGMIAHNAGTPGRVTISLVHGSGFNGDGVVATVVARVAGKDGATSALRLENVTAHSAQTKAAIPTSVSNGNFTEGGGMSGNAGVIVLFALLGVVIIGAGAYAFTRRTTSRRAAPAPGSAALSLRVVSGSASPSVYPLSQPQTNLGRSSSNHVIVNDDMVSREHCRIVSGQGVHTIYDSGSSNGTIVNGQRVSRQILQAGDRITLGSTTLEVQ